MRRKSVFTSQTLDAMSKSFNGVYSPLDHIMRQMYSKINQRIDADDMQSRNHIACEAYDYLMMAISRLNDLFKFERVIAGKEIIQPSGVMYQRRERLLKAKRKICSAIDRSLKNE